MVKSVSTQKLVTKVFKLFENNKTQYLTIELDGVLNIYRVLYKPAGVRLVSRDLLPCLDDKGYTHEKSQKETTIGTTSNY